MAAVGWELLLALVRSFFALSIGDNIRSFSQSSLGNYHWLRAIRLLRLQKTNSSLAELPLPLAAHRKAPSLYRPRKAAAAWGHAALPYGGVIGRDERQLSDAERIAKIKSIFGMK